MYTQEQLNQLVTDILGNLSDQGKVSDLLNDFRTDYTGTLTDYDKVTKDNESLLKNNESLRNVNNKMMLQLGDVSSIVSKEKEDKQKEEEEQKIEDQKEPYSDLFGEDGELK
jgi:regulator of replication initiation timing